MIAGTTAYMSPEQARGKAVDKRTDIWAFGCVLYEMLTARPAFRGETASDTIAAILEREPDWSALPAQTPASIRRLLQRCLEKDPKRRLRDIGDARLEIEEALGSSVASAGPRTGESRSPDAGCQPGPARLVGPGRGRAADHRRRGDVAAAALGVLLAESAGRRDGHEVDGFRGSGAPRRHFPRREVRRLSFRPRRNVGRVGQPGRDRRCLQPHQRQCAGVAESRRPALLAFNPDGSLVTLWSRVSDSARGGLVNAGWAVPTLGGPLRPYLEDISDISELDWSPDGRRIVYHPPADGDPLFVTEPDEKVRASDLCGAERLP